MEAVASGMAVVSLAIQLVDTVATIKTLIRNAKGSQKRVGEAVLNGTVPPDALDGDVEKPTKL
ncbi:hypothetical protein CFE70_009710 [Pyrenophora teres f. teres 0-1]|uniref:Uncharacterized protein n=1 Tax=Pyrenophora teres f. teres (strain 0-1) TaxID=861557 RepID=E3RZZ3_PYRTT|nr:hypothetical protein PTT_15328 [Pyrenophora teres f. teres 0-1]